MTETNSDIGSSFVAVDGSTGNADGVTLAPNDQTLHAEETIRGPARENNNGNAVAIDVGSSGIGKAAGQSEFQLSIELAKAVATLWKRQPENVMPSPGPLSMPGLTERAKQYSTKNGDTCYTGWQAYSTYSFLRFRTLGPNEWDWNIYSSWGLGTNVNVHPAVGGQNAPQMSARFGALWAVLHGEAFGGSSRSNVTAIPYEDETGAMTWIANRLQSEPAHWYDEDVFLRLYLIGMLCPDADKINEDRLPYVVDPELYQAKVFYNECAPAHKHKVPAMAIPIDVYISIYVGKTNKAAVPDLFNVAEWDKHVAVVPLRAADEGAWLVPYVFSHLSTEIWNAQTYSVTMEHGWKRFDALPNASLCHVSGPTRLLIVLVDCTSRNVTTNTWRLGTGGLGVEIPVWYANRPAKTVEIEELFWSWFQTMGERGEMRGSCSTDVGHAWHRLCVDRQVGTQVMSAVMMASEVCCKRFWPKAIPAQVTYNPRRDDVSQLDNNTLLAELRSRVMAGMYQDAVSDWRLLERALSGMTPPPPLPTAGPLNKITGHRIDTSKFSQPNGWFARWAAPDEAYQRNYSHLVGWQVAGGAVEEIFWHPPLPTDRTPPYIVQLWNAPDIITKDGTAKVHFGVVTIHNYYEHYDLVPCQSWEDAYDYCITGEPSWTYITKEGEEQPRVEAEAVLGVVERFRSFDVMDLSKAPDPEKCGYWWTASSGKAKQIEKACRCQNVFKNYADDLTDESAAKAAFCPIVMLRSSPHMRNWSAEWKFDERSMSLVGKTTTHRAPVNRVDEGGTPRWLCYGYSVTTGNHLWRVAGMMQLYVASGAPIEFVDARRMALTAKGTATLIGAVWDAYVGSRGVNASLAHCLFRSAPVGDLIMDALWAPTLGHISHWTTNGSWWHRRDEVKMPLLLLRNDTTTKWSEIFPALTPHYEEKMVLGKFGLYNDNNWWPVNYEVIPVDDEVYKSGLTTYKANEVLKEDQIGESLSAADKVPRCCLHRFVGNNRGSWSDAIPFAGPWQLYDHVSYHSTAAVRLDEIQPFGLVVHPSRVPRFCQGLARISGLALWSETVVTQSGTDTTQVSMEWPDPDLLRALVGVGKGIVRMLKGDVLGGLAQVGIVPVDMVADALRSFANVPREDANQQGE